MTQEEHTGNLCGVCKETIGAVELIRRQQVTDADWIVENYHESCYVEQIIREMNLPPDCYADGSKIKELPF